MEGASGRLRYFWNRLLIGMIKKKSFCKKEIPRHNRISRVLLWGDVNGDAVLDLMIGG